MTAINQKVNLLSHLRAFAETISAEKTASAALPASKAQDPPTTHPVGKVDNGTKPATEGSRSAENIADVKEDIGKPGVTDETPITVNQTDSQFHIGMTPSATGEDPSVERRYGGHLHEPGTTSPVKADMGEKYSSVSFREARDICGKLQNEILADLAVGLGQQLKVAGAAAPGQPAAPAAAATAAQATAAAAKIASVLPVGTPANEAAQAGYELAAAAGIDKAAAASYVAGIVEDTIRDANLDADLLGQHLRQLTKRAGADTMSDAGASEDHSAPGDENPGTNGGASASPGGGAGGAPEGGDPAGGAPDGGDPGAGAGADGGASQEQAIQQLIAALDELGIPIEALAGAGGGGGGAPPPGGAPPGGGMPPDGGMGGGMPPGGAPPPGMGAPPPGMDPAAMGGAPPPDAGAGMKLAAACKAYKKSGRYQFKTANPGTPERQLRDEMKLYARELLGI